MLDLLLRLWVAALPFVGVYVLLLTLILAGAFIVAALWILAEGLWGWVVRRIRRWRIARDLDRDRARDAYERRIRAAALTGTTGVPRSVWEDRHPPAGGPKRAA